MSALSRLITKCTKRQLQIATTVEQISTIIDRTIAFAEAETPYISDEEIDSLLPYIPVTEIEQEPAESDSDGSKDDDGANSQEAEENASEAVSELESMTKAELIQYAENRGIEVSSSWTKAEIIAAIREAV